MNALRKNLLSLLLAALACGAATGQPPRETPLPELHNKDFVYNAKRMRAPIRIDGVADEPDWQNAQKATDFF